MDVLASEQSMNLFTMSVCVCVFLLFQTHVVESSRPGRVGPTAVLEFWVGILTQQNLWYRDRTVLFLMDQICRSAFTHHQEECIQRLLYQQHKVHTERQEM